MLKRLCWLAFFAAALFLLLGLAARAPDSLPAPPRTITQAALAVQPQPVGEAAPRAGLTAALTRLAAPEKALCQAAEAPPQPPTRLPYHQARYQAFHYPDEAG